MTITVDFLVFPGIQLLDLAGPHEVFASLPCQTAPRIEQIQDEISGIIDHFEACQNAHLTFVYQLGDLPVTLWKAVQYSALMAVQPMPLIDIKCLLKNIRNRILKADLSKNAPFLSGTNYVQDGIFFQRCNSSEIKYWTKSR